MLMGRLPRQLEWQKFAPMHNHTENAATGVAPSMVHSIHHVQGITTHCSQLCGQGPITGSTQSTIPV